MYVRIAKHDVALRRSSRRVALLDRALPDDLADALWDRPEELIARGEPLRSVGVRQTVKLHWASRRFVLKHYVEPSRRHAVKRLLLLSRAAMTWKISHRLVEAGIPTPCPVACIENRWGPFGRDSLLMYPYVDGRPLRSYFDGTLCSNDVVRDRLWRQYCQLWEQIGRLRVTLGDANLANFIVAPNGRLWVIDLDKTRFHQFDFTTRWHRRRRWRQVLRCLAQCESERRVRAERVDAAAA